MEYQKPPAPVRKKQSNEVVEFQNHKKAKLLTNVASSSEKRNWTKKTNEIKEENETENKEIVSLKQAKFDVFKFGIKGFDKEAQENAKMQLAIKLGAAPPKNKCLNYKELLQLKQEEKAKKDQALKENNLFAAKISSSKLNITRKKTSANSRRKSKINKGHVGNLKGHIGSFSDGVLKIKKHELKKMKI